MNKQSNRAHRIFTILVRHTRFDVEVPSALTFVDLAGSEVHLWQYITRPRDWDSLYYPYYH